MEENLGKAGLWGVSEPTHPRYSGAPRRLDDWGPRPNASILLWASPTLRDSTFWPQLSFPLKMRPSTESACLLGLQFRPDCSANTVQSLIVEHDNSSSTDWTYCSYSLISHHKAPSINSPIIETRILIKTTLQNNKTPTRQHDNPTSPLLLPWLDHDAGRRVPLSRLLESVRR